MKIFLCVRDGYIQILCIIKLVIVYKLKRNIGKKINESCLVGGTLCKREIDYGNGGIFYALFSAPTKKYCLTLIENVVFEEHKMFKVFLI